MLMIEQLQQFHLLAQRNAEDWMDILFWVVVAAVWAIAGIVKAGAGRRSRKGKSAPQKTARQESFLDRLAKKAEEMQRAAQLRSGQGTEHRRHPDSQGRPPRPTDPPRAAPGRVTTRPGRGGQPVLVYERSTSPPAAQRDRPAPPRPNPVRSKPQQHRTPKSTPLPTPRQIPVVTPVSEDIPPRRPRTPEPTVAIGAGDSPFVDFSAPGALRKAILQIEILGTPLGLREPFE